MNIFQCVVDDDIYKLRIICAQAHSNQYLEQTDEYGNTPLLKACYLGKLESARNLISFGADFGALNYFGQNALTLATYSGNLALVQELLRHRSYSDFNMSSIIPALCVATLRQDIRLIEFFENLDKEQTGDLQTAHGLSPSDINEMLRELSQRQNRQ